ncbi:RagB/SusD family nutrient uptake outer membrane protein [Sabulilitoribacter arenilitoris]|uniref:RagB/SusD family nutrient uptake outer membrane protein n=1 Tax=Wocania arenilitoris TaxID=2044858 RepID=A0AAE3EPN5_9FLAO|nr:RagB/SusD family nutrient uptake outer membrane protein [Wocania arenilitoris]MCF7568277.1 RagB/SusD family nutrient uptake outer membrane protein [Wocania arenilitoris]
MKKVFLFILCSALFVACSGDHLDVNPNVNTDVVIQSVDDLDRLFYGTIATNGTEHQANVWCTDNASMPQEILDETSSFSDEQQEHYTFSTIMGSRSSDQTWRSYYGQMLVVSNLVLEQLEEGQIKGIEDQALVDLLTAEAHFYRAHNHFNVALTYALYPNEANNDELGIVIKQTSSVTESQERATVKETFDFILTELDEALKYPNTEKKGRFRIGKPSVHALAARIHLYLGNYDKAKTHADTALSGFSTMINFENSISILPYTLWYGPYVYPNTAQLASWQQAGSDFYNDQYWYFYETNGYWNTSPSQELLDLYDPADIRNVFYIDGWFSRNGATTNTWTSYMNMGPGDTYAGPNVAEMYLTRAECKARDNDFAGAMADVEMVRINRFAVADYSPLSIPTSDKDAVNEVLNERRREAPFTLRFMDIKRLNNDPLTDPIVITRNINGETITIQPDSRSWARPIGDEIIILSGGATVQNQY